MDNYNNNNTTTTTNAVSVVPPTVSNKTQKIALDALPSLLFKCRQVVDGEESDDDDHQEDDRIPAVEASLFLVYSIAEEWIQDEWPTILLAARHNKKNNIDVVMIITSRCPRVGPVTDGPDPCFPQGKMPTSKVVLLPCLQFDSFQF